MTKKKTLLLITIAILIIAGIAILWLVPGSEDKNKESGKKEEQVNITPTKKAEMSVKSGYYVLENGNNSFASLLIQNENKYSFSTSPFSSQLGGGKYEIDGDILVCTEDSFGRVYKFKILDDGKLSILTEESSKIDEYGMDYKIQDGDIFVFDKEFIPEEADKTVTEGRYVLENGKNEYASLTIEADNKFQIGFSPASSHLEFGEYEIDGDILTCTEDTFGKIYKFQITDEGKLSILTEESSSLAEYGMDYKIQDGDIFILEEAK